MGEDLILFLSGGEKPHIGAVAVAIPYKTTSSASLISIQEHKDGDLAKPLAERIAKQLKKKVILVVGIHIDNATKEDIQTLVDKSYKEVDEFIRQYKN